MIIEQLESKISSGRGLNSLTDSELSQLAIHFVGDAPPSHVPRETVINILSEQESVKKWQQGVIDKAKQLASSKISETVENVQSKISFPKFIIFFLLAILMGSVLNFEENIILIFKIISQYILLFGLFCIGSQSNIRDLRTLNYKSLFFAFGLWIVVIPISYIIVTLN